MNHFTKSLKIHNISKLLDNEILQVITNELNKLQSTCEISEYWEQIESRKKSLTYFFKDFDNNMRILETYTRFRGIDISSDSSPSHQVALDRILSKKILEKLENLLEEKLNSFFRTSSSYTNAIISQISDRQICIASLFENFNQKMEIVQNSKINKQSLSIDEHSI